MKSITIIVLALLATSILSAAENPSLIKNLGKMNEVPQYYNTGSGGRTSIAVNDKVFFFSELSDSELWVSDGTTDTTVKIKTSSNDGFDPNFVNVGDYVFFSEGLNLWKSDGTETGTVVVKAFSESEYYTKLNPVPGKNVLYIYILDKENNVELWKYTVSSSSASTSTISIKKINVKLDSGSANKDQVIISKGEFPSAVTSFDPNTNKVYVNVGEHEFDCTSGNGTWKANSKGTSFKFKSTFDPKIQMSVNLDKSEWSFKAGKTEVHQDIDVSKDIPVSLKIDDTTYGNDFSMTMKAKLDYKQ